MSIGIPFAPSRVTSIGTHQTCPVCGEDVFTPLSEFDSDGEHLETAATPYQLHFLIYHPAS
jgi:hypothetical protein